MRLVLLRRQVTQTKRGGVGRVYREHERFGAESRRLDNTSETRERQIQPVWLAVNATCPLCRKSIFVPDSDVESPSPDVNLT